MIQNIELYQDRQLSYRLCSRPWIGYFWIFPHKMQWKFKISAIWSLMLTLLSMQHGVYFKWHMPIWVEMPLWTNIYANSRGHHRARFSKNYRSLSPNSFTSVLMVKDHNWYQHRLQCKQLLNYELRWTGDSTKICITEIGWVTLFVNTVCSN